MFVPDIWRVFSCNPGCKCIKLTQKFLGFLQYCQTNDGIGPVLYYISIFVIPYYDTELNSTLHNTAVNTAVKNIKLPEEYAKYFLGQKGVRLDNPESEVRYVQLNTIFFTLLVIKPMH